VGILSVFVDYHRRGNHHRGAVQPQIGPLIAALLPGNIEVEIINDTWVDPDWNRDYDLLFIACLNSDFDRARQISHYWRRRGATTVLGGNFASAYSALCQPYFDAVVIGDAESTVPLLYRDFCRGELRPVYRGLPYDSARVPVPRLDLAADQQVLPLAIEASRGCPFTCEFCILTGVGTRYHARPAHSVVQEIQSGQESLRDIVPWLRRRIAIFHDNNLGGNLGILRELCDAVTPLRIWWGACATFNVISNADIVRRLAKAGCRCIFVGLESFSPATIAHMGKHQNAVAKTRAALDLCRDNGILIMAGLMLSPTMDSADYIESIPERLREIGLYVPTFISFETPFPGTPHFTKVASQGERAFMPNALLRDFNGYTLVTRPAHASAEEFVAAYKRCYREVYSRRSRLRKLLADIARLKNGGLVPVFFDMYELLSEDAEPAMRRTFIAGTDIEPPETGQIPFSDDDFESREERDRILQPWAVSDEQGRALPHWLDARRIYSNKGRMALDTDISDRAA
jgi:radical SAM superfamily enzyme YgiQ (UPF0313 family)